jgi:hypothetical protein
MKKYIVGLFFVSSGFLLSCKSEPGKNWISIPKISLTIYLGPYDLRMG